MTIRAAAAGMGAGESITDATTRRLMAYAAGIGADEACYLDDLRDGGVVAHPAYCVSLEWPLAGGPLLREALGLPREGPRGAVHVQQDSRFHRTLRTGERLRTRARIVQVKPTAAGALVVTRLDTSEAVHGAAVTTSHSSAMFLRQALEGEAAQTEEPPALVDDPAEHASSIAIETSRLAAHVYTECAEIWNPIHTERSAAQALGLPDVILHGTCTWALAMQALVREVAKGDPARLLRFAGRFHAMVFPGDRLTLEWTVKGAQCLYRVMTPRGEPAIRQGIAEFAQ